jgi:hypothetical protein
MGIAYNTSIVTDNLVFALDAGNTRSYSGSGTTAYSLNNNINLNLNNGVGFTSANRGMFSFDGTNDNLTSTDYNMPFVNNSEYTFEAVCKFNSNPNSYQTVLLYGNLSYEGFVLGKARSGFNNYEGVGGAVYGGIYGPGVAIIAAGTINGDQTVSMGMIHFAYTISKPSTVYVAKLYINGQLNSTNTTGASSYTFGSLNTFNIGGPSGDSVNGNIAMVKVYNRALSAKEIAQNFNATRDRYGI